MAKIVVTANVTHRGVTYTTNEVRHIRTREAEELIALNKVKKA